MRVFFRTVVSPYTAAMLVIAVWYADLAVRSMQRPEDITYFIPAVLTLAAVVAVLLLSNYFGSGADQRRIRWLESGRVLRDRASQASHTFYEGALATVESLRKRETAEFEEGMKSQKAFYEDMLADASHELYAESWRRGVAERMLKKLRPLAEAMCGRPWRSGSQAEVVTLFLEPSPDPTSPTAPAGILQIPSESMSVDVIAEAG